MYKWLVIFVSFLLSFHTIISVILNGNENSTLTEFLLENKEVGKQSALSRRKRFILFPDGSSLQLVFCNQMSALIPIGDIFLFGYTAALAWSLPSDPKYIHLFKDLERPLRRSNQITKTINYIDEKGRIIAKVPYKKRIIVNPAFAKRSVDYNKTIERKKIDKKKMHENHLHRHYLSAENMDKDSIEFHRSNKLELYPKLETLITSLGRDGRQCVLYKLCETAQRRPRQRTFLQELVDAVFTLPKGEKFDLEEHKEYDAAHTTSDDCLTRYPGCAENI